MGPHIAEVWAMVSQQPSEWGWTSTRVNHVAPRCPQLPSVRRSDRVSAVTLPCKHLAAVGSVLGHLVRRWPNTEPTAVCACRYSLLLLPYQADVCEFIPSTSEVICQAGKLTTTNKGKTKDSCSVHYVGPFQRPANTRRCKSVTVADWHAFCRILRNTRSTLFLCWVSIWYNDPTWDQRWTSVLYQIFGWNHISRVIYHQVYQSYHAPTWCPH